MSYELPRIDLLLTGEVESEDSQSAMSEKGALG